MKKGGLYMGVSIIDIAKLAGVSKSTVSAVINNHPNVRTSTRERVMVAVRQLDYHPNIAARELITASPMNIGIIMPTYNVSTSNKCDKYFSGIDEGSNFEIVSELIEKISHTKYGALIEHTLISDNEPALPSFALSKRVSGIFQISPLLTSSYTHKLQQYVPYVTEIGTLNPECDSVYTDYTHIVSLSVDYLVRAGHRKIAFINCDPSSRTVSSRLKGYTSALEHNGIDYNEKWVQNSLFNGVGGYRAFSEIWHNSKDKPTAVICAAGVIAAGAVRFMMENGICVPDAVSVITNGDSILTEFITPQLTAICRDKSEIATAAFSLLLERLNNPSMPIRAIKTPEHIIERNSVKRLNG